MTDITSTTASIPTVGRGGIRRGLRGLRSEISIHSDLSIGLTEIQTHRFGLGQAYLGLPGLILGSIRGGCRRGKGGGSIPTDGLLMKCIQFQAITVLQERERTENEKPLSFHSTKGKTRTNEILPQLSQNSQHSMDSPPWGHVPKVRWRGSTTS